MWLLTPGPSPTLVCLINFLKSLLFWFWVLPWRKFPQEHVKQGNKAVTACTDKSSCYTLTSFLPDYQIEILGKILSVVNFGLCNKSAVVEKKLCEQSSRVWAPFWALISIFSRQDFSKETGLHTETPKKRDCLARCLTSCVPHSECVEQSALCMRRITTHTISISPLRGQPAAGEISLSANVWVSGIWAVIDIIKM